jgi:curved DNA-binding protein
MGRESLYSLLGVEPSATLDDVKRAYRRLVMQYHPDSGKPGASQEMFHNLTIAYETLIDSERRREYDELNGFRKTAPEPDQKFERANKHLTEDGLKKANYAVPPSLRLSGRYSREELMEEDEQNGAGSLMSKIGERYKNLLKGGEASEDLSKREFLSQFDTETYSTEIEITSTESVLGTVKELVIDDEQTIRVRIASGVNDGDILGVQISKGLIRFRVRIRTEGIVQREGNDIIVSVPIALSEAINGADIEVPTLTGPVKIKLPARWDVEKRLRLKGKGVRDHNGHYGNLYVKTHIVVPFDLNESEITAAQEFSKRHAPRVRAHFPQQLKYSK